MPVTFPVAKLDSEIADPTTVNKNLVLVGGPCVNSLAQRLVDDGKIGEEYTCAGGVPGSAWETGAAYIIAVEDAFVTGKVAMLVAGTTADDTRLATSVLQQYEQLADITASTVKVTGTVESPTITEV